MSELQIMRDKVETWLTKIWVLANVWSLV